MLRSLAVALSVKVNSYLAPYGADWVATDGYVRHVTDYSDAPLPRDNKFVGMCLLIMAWIFQHSN